MERNRVLWVIFSISLFLVVVLAAGLYFLRPKAPAGAEMTAPRSPSMESFDAFEYVRGRSRLPGLREEQDQAEEMVIIVGEPEQPAPSPGDETQGEIPVAREIVPAPSPVSPPTPSPSAAGPVTRVERPQREPAPSPAPKPAPRPTPKPAPKPAPEPVRVTEYWIQVGSFASRARAEELTASLSEKGLAPKVTTKALGGATHYRVRLGPYPNRAEAAKFLEWVKALEGLEGSYISMVTVQRPRP